MVKPELRAYEFKLSDILSTYQLSKQAVLNNDLNLFNDLKMEIKRSNKEMNLEGKLSSLGYKMLHRGKNEWAIRIFKLNVELFPESANDYDSLGEVYMKVGENELAIENYKKFLQLDPQNENAVKMLRKLETEN